MSNQAKATFLRLLAIVFAGVAAWAFYWIAHHFGSLESLTQLDGFKLINALEVAAVSLLICSVAYLKALHLMDVFLKDKGKPLDHTHGEEANKMVIKTVLVIFASMVVIATVMVLQHLLKQPAF